MSRKKSAAQIAAEAAEEQRITHAQRELLERAQSVLGGREQWLDWGVVSQRFRTELSEILKADKIVFCSHIPTMRPEEMRHVNAWDLTHIGCEPCVALRQMLMVASSPEEDKRCDGCKVIFEDGLYPNVAVIGNIALHFGLCDNCRVEEDVSR